MSKIETNLEQIQDATHDRNDAENHRKTSQNSSREGPQDAPKSILTPSPSTLERRKTIGAPKVPKNSRKSAESRPQHTQVGPKNRAKSDPGPKKCVQRRRQQRFLLIFLAVAVRSRSRDRFWLDFTPKITPKSKCFLTQAAEFVRHGDLKDSV